MRVVPSRVASAIGKQMKAFSFILTKNLRFAPQFFCILTGIRCVLSLYAIWDSPRFGDDQGHAYHIIVFDFLWFLLLTIIMWHAYLYVLFSWLGKNSRLRKTFVKAIDYVWLSTAGFAIVLGVHQSYLSDRKIDEDYHLRQAQVAKKEFALRNLESFDASCAMALQGKKLPSRYVSLCYGYIAALDKHEYLIENCNDVYIYFNQKDFEKDRNIHVLDNYCIQAEQISSYENWARIEVSLMKELDFLPSARSDQWLMLLVLALGLRITKVSAEVAEIFW